MRHLLRSSAVMVTLLAAGCGPDLLEGDSAGASGLGDSLSTTQQAVTAAVCPGPSTVPGIDVSVWQGAINWGAVGSSGQKFAIARVSYGISTQDRYFAANWPAMKAAGLLRGAYQFFLPDQDAVAQANVVIAAVGRLGPGDLPVMLDMEDARGQSPATITAKLHQWVDAITAGTGRAPIIYTGAYFWDASVKTTDFSHLPLNVAWYGTNCPGEPNAWAGHHWVFHQYSSSGSVAGISGRVDMNVFNGTLDDLRNLAHVNQAPRGWLDAAGCASIAGWAQDEDTPGAATTVKLSFDGAWSARPALSLTADDRRADLCTAINSCNHGYATPVPLSLQDGHAHSVHAYAVDTGDGSHVELSGSPKSFTCTAALPRGVKRHVQNPTSYAAWKFDPLWNQVTVSDAVLSGYPTSDPWLLAPRVIKASGPAVYVVDGTTRRHVPIPAAMQAWRFSSVATVTDAELARYAEGPELPATPTLVKGSGAAVYLLDAAPLPPPAPTPSADAGATDPTAVTEPTGAPAPSGDGTVVDSSTAPKTAAVGGCSAAPGSLDSGSLALLVVALEWLLASRRRAA